MPFRRRYTAPRGRSRYSSRSRFGRSRYTPRYRSRFGRSSSYRPRRPMSGFRY